MKWTAAYYPSDLIENPRAKTIFCLLFDQVIFHFPISGMACGGGSGISELYSDDVLVEAGILELREEVLLSDVTAEFDSDEARSEESFNTYYDLNVAGMAINCASEEGAVLATANPNAPLPICLLRALETKRSAGMQASALAIQSLNLTLPDFRPLESHDVLELRDRLKNELVPFRNAMLTLAPKVRSGIVADASPSEVFKEAQYIVETDIQPRIEELKRKLKLEKGAFWRKITHKTLSAAPDLALKWLSGGQVAAMIESAKIGGGIASDAVTNDLLRNQLLYQGGLSFLVKCEEYMRSKAPKD